MSLNVNGPMTYARAIELRAECEADLTEANRQRHSGWVRTLDGRLEKLDELVTSKRRRLAADDPRFAA